MKSKTPAKSMAAGPTTAAAKSAVVRKPSARKTTSVALASAVANDGVAAAVPAELIAQRAYEIFVEQGAEHGRDTEHWLAAERELLTRA